MNAQTGLDALRDAGKAWNEGDLDGYLALYGPEVVLHGYPGVAPGHEGARQFYLAFWTAFPGSQLVIEDVFACGGDRVVCRFHVLGRHDGPFNGLPASGKTAVLPGITILRFGKSGRCVERWSQSDFLGLMQQLGALTGA